MSALARLPGLDGLRGVAVLAVIAYHLNLSNFLPAGFLGVDIFFTVSGFIITALMLQEHAQTGRIDFAAFYLRRARRLFPAALFMLLVLVALTPLLQASALPRLREDLPAAFFYVSNWWQIVAQQSYFEAIEQPRLLQHLWSLAVEEQYYLLWPLLCWWLLQRVGQTGLGLAAAGIAIASTLWMAWVYVTHIVDGDPSRVYLGTDTHLMGLLAGSALAAWYNPWQIRTSSVTDQMALNLAGSAALAALVWGMVQAHEGMPGLYQGGFLLAAALTCCVIGSATRPGTWLIWVLATRPMRWFGTRSYSLYLWHWPVMVWLAPSVQADVQELVWITAARLCLTAVCAEASFRWIETRWAKGFLTTPWQRRSSVVVAALLVVNTWVLVTMPTPERPALPMAAPPALAPTQALPNAATPTALTDKADSGAARTALLLGNTTTPATAYQRVTLIGDSVLLGASPYLLRRLPAASVEAKVGRQGSDGLKIVQLLRHEKQLGDALVIHLGTNGYLLESQFKALLDHVADRKTVVIVNVYGARRWTAPNNALIARLSQNFDNVQLVDWHAIGQANPGYFVHDGIHLSGSGIHAYYSQIRMALGQAEINVTDPTLKQVVQTQRPKRPAAQASNRPSQAVSTAQELSRKPLQDNAPAPSAANTAPASSDAAVPAPVPAPPDDAFDN